MSWIRSPRANPSASLRFFVFHHAGGMGNAYFQWHSRMPSEVELLIIDLPGRGMSAKEKRLESFDVLIRNLKEQIAPFLDKPFIFLGHSLGALLAYELACTLPSEPLKSLRGLGLSAFKPPTEKNLQDHPVISHLPDEAFMQKVQEIAPLPLEITQHSETLAYFLSLIRSDLRLIDSYPAPHRARISLPALVFGGDADPQISPASLKEWNQFVEVRGETRIYPGNHFFIFQNSQAILDEMLGAFL